MIATIRAGLLFCAYYVLGAVVSLCESGVRGLRERGEGGEDYEGGDRC